MNGDRDDSHRNYSVEQSKAKQKQKHCTALVQPYAAEVCNDRKRAKQRDEKKLALSKEVWSNGPESSIEETVKGTS